MKIQKFSKIGFIMAAAGSAVGLGNIWKFPYMTGEYGGGAFVLVYLVTIAFIGFSVMIAEMLIGALGKKDTVSSFEELAPPNKKWWKYAGFMGFNGIIIMTFYSVVIGWILYYLFYVVLAGLPSDTQTAKNIFSDLVGNEILAQIFFHTVSTIIVGYVVYRGIKGGIEKVNLILMPALMIILFGLLVYASSLDGFSKALAFMFEPKWEKLNSEAFIRAIGHSFFTLSLGMGAIMTYAASLPKDASITKTAFIVTFMDTLIALVAGLVIFSFLFQFGAKPGQGPGLVFISLPTILNNFGTLGIFFALLFFLALAFAGLTSAVSLVEPVVQYFIDRFNMTRTKAVVVTSIVYWLVGIAALLSFTNSWGKVFSIAGKPLFDILEFTTDSILLPLGGFAIVIFVGYVLPKTEVRAHLHKPGELTGNLFSIWMFSIRYIAPVALIFMMLNLMGIVQL
ncbi:MULTISPECIES: sodium-dependent transporter [unclassified Nitratiruptor]|uniref:sodium-dependent transporter n=1 Tax=unclassified Nitratiruptor TaxID=2624044 RepID=UPI001915A7B2|nr:MULTISPECIES: sodium-dependent transporter [unclassified Nitratiruptor]BCD59456.1 neurotransmitter:Na+ symporter, NSS family [Nitratiruptor sp. YY08-10]BCD63380.1 neurotransmitter:Na+ symporter, NSS family [Nitratiruptor sp. YY08-14]